MSKINSNNKTIIDNIKSLSKDIDVKVLAKEKPSVTTYTITYDLDGGIGMTSKIIPIGGINVVEPKKGRLLFF